MNTVTVAVPTPDEREIRRYARCPDETPLPIDECLSELNGLTYRVCYCEYPLKMTQTGLDLGFACTNSRDLARALDGCDRIVLFAATVGLAPDRLIAKYNRLSPAKALIVQAIGAERVEALCDAFCDSLAREYAQRGDRLRPRFSPGYGDLPLSLQRDVVAALDLTRQLGITLNDSLLMTPSKSVTAIIGVSTCEKEASR